MTETEKQKVQQAWMGQAMENLPLHQQSEHLKERSGTVCTNQEAWKKDTAKKDITKRKMQRIKKHGRKILPRKISRRERCNESRSMEERYNKERYHEEKDATKKDTTEKDITKKDTTKGKLPGEEVGMVARFQPPTKVVVAQFQTFQATAGTVLSTF